MPPADNENVELLLAEVKLEKKKKTILREPIEEPAAEKSNDGTEEDLKKVAAFREEEAKEILDEDISVPMMETTEERNVDDAVLPFLDNTEKKRVLQTASELGIRDKKRLHEQLIKYRNSMNEWKRKEKETQNQRG